MIYWRNYDMNVQKINQIFADTAYVRMGGSAEELKAA